MGDLTWKDLDDQQALGRNAARETNPLGLEWAIQTAALNIVIAEGEEKARLRVWFHEGVRNSADNQFQVDAIMWKLRDRIKESEATLV